MRREDGGEGSAVWWNEGFKVWFRQARARVSWWISGEIGAK